MPNTFRLNAQGTDGFDFVGFLDTLSGPITLISDNGSRAVFSTSDASTEFTLRYDLVGIQFGVTGLTVRENGTITATSSFASPEPTGLGTWPTSGVTLIGTLFNDTRVVMNGKAGEDVLRGFNLADSFKTDAGRDVTAGFGGNDRFDLGAGNDYAHGGGGADTISTAGGNDMARTGSGRDTVRTGGGNDVIEASEGNNTLFGGADKDLFIFDTGVTGRSTVRDFTADDVILFGGVASAPTSQPSALTLADVMAGSVDDFSWKETSAGHLRLNAGDQTVILRNTDAADVLVEQLYFGGGSANQIVAAFSDGPEVVLGTALNGEDLSVDAGPNVSSLNYQEIEWTVFSFPDSNMVSFGTEATT